MVRRTAVVARLVTAAALSVPFIVLASYPAHGQSQAGRTLVSHDFATSAQGWRISSDTGTTDPIFNSSGGSPGGCITGIDEAIGETWYFLAPGAVLQQLAAAENGTISFSLKQSTIVDGGFLDDDVVIVGTAGRIGYRFGFGSAPGTRWKEFFVRLSEGPGWRWNLGAPATQAQIHSVLAAPLRLEIRGEYVTGPDEGALDNFILNAHE